MDLNPKNFTNWPEQQQSQVLGLALTTMTLPAIQQEISNLSTERRRELAVFFQTAGVGAGGGQRQTS